MDSSLCIRRGTVDDTPVILHHRRGMMAEMGVGDADSRAAYAVDFPAFVRR